MSKLDKDQVIEAFTAAYKAANGKEPQIEAKGGWYSVDGGKNVRLGQIQEMTDSLGSAPAPKVEEKKEEKAAAPKKAAKKPAAKKAAKKADKSFSVKDYWKAKLAEKDPNLKTPR